MGSWMRMFFQADWNPKSRSAPLSNEAPETVNPTGWNAPVACGQASCRSRMIGLSQMLDKTTAPNRPTAIRLMRGRGHREKIGAP